MLKNLSSLAIILVLLTGLAPLSATAEVAPDAARIVVYRADESSRTQKVKFKVQLNQESQGRLKYNRTLVVTPAAGAYELGISLKGAEPLSIDLKPGQTYYVHTKIRQRGTRLIPELVLVEEQLAVSQQPSIGQLI